jgi:hypothetical protein
LQLMEEGSKKLAGAFMAGGGGAAGKTEEGSVVTAGLEEEKKEVVEEDKDEESEVWIPPLPQENEITDVRTRVDLEIFSGICERGYVAFEGGGAMESSFLLDLLSNVLLFCLRGVSAYGNSLRSTCIQYQHLYPDSSQILKQAPP